MKRATTIIIFSVGMLLAVGMVILYSATSEAGYLKRQFVGLCLGLVFAGFWFSVDYRHLKKFSAIGFLLSLVLLALIYVPNVGVYKNGATRWIKFGGVQFQPSEMAKIALIVALAHYAEFAYRNMGEMKRGLFYPGLLCGAIVSLVFLEPDRGTSILMAGVCGVILIVAGVPWRNLALVGALGIAVVGFSLSGDTMRLTRIDAWINPDAHLEGKAYQANQAKMAIGSGGILGTGLGEGRQKHGFIPEHHTDFIFSIIGEEMGMVGTMGVVLGFLAFVLSGTYVALNARDRFGLYLAAGITFLIGMQAFINIGVVTSALPNKGLPLPFIGFGGTSLLAMLICVGILLSVARFSAVTLPSPVGTKKGGKR